MKNTFILLLICISIYYISVYTHLPKTLLGERVNINFEDYKIDSLLKKSQSGTLDLQNGADILEKNEVKNIGDINEIKKNSDLVFLLESSYSERLKFELPDRRKYAEIAFNIPGVQEKFIDNINKYKKDAIESKIPSDFGIIRNKIDSQIGTINLSNILAEEIANYSSNNIVWKIGRINYDSIDTKIFSQEKQKKYIVNYLLAYYIGGDKKINYQLLGVGCKNIDSLNVFVRGNYNYKLYNGNPESLFLIDKITYKDGHTKNDDFINSLSITCENLNITLEDISKEDTRGQNELYNHIINAFLAVYKKPYDNSK